MLTSTNGWQRVFISDVCELVTDCVNRTPPLVDEQTPYVMIRTTNVKDGRVDLSGARYVALDTYRKWTRRATVRPGDVILTREAPLGQVGMVRCHHRICLGQRLMQYRADPEYLDSRFLLYSLMGHDIQSQIKALGSGATVEHMRVADARQLTMVLPSLEIQRKIGSTLSAYDDLIENNLCRMAILEEMAQAIYREWFVEFRYPGYEDSELVESEWGPIPDRWEVVRLSDAVQVNPATKVDKERGKPYLDMAGLSTSSMVVQFKETRTGVSGTKFRNGDTLVARITPCLENGKTGFVQGLGENEVALGSTEFIVLRSVLLCPEYVYLMARTDSFRQHAIKSMTGASGRQRVQTTCFNAYQLAVPPQRLLDQFSMITAPMFKQAWTLSEINRKLRQTRDLLLPRLISGELDVSNITIDTEEDEL